MKNISIYRPTTVDEAIQIVSHHGTEAGVYAGGTDLLIRLKNRLQQAPTYLVDIKKIDNLRYIKEDADGTVRIRHRRPNCRSWPTPPCSKRNIRCWSRPSTRSHRPSSAMPQRSAAICCKKSGANIFAAVIRAGETADTSCFGAIGDNSYYHSAMGGPLMLRRLPRRRRDQP